MFFRSKYLETFFQKLEKKSDEKFHLLQKMLVSENKNLKKQLDENITIQLKENSNTIMHEISRLQSSLHKHDMAIEDFLDTLEEKSSENERIQNQYHESEQAQKQLLALFETYQEQFWNLKRFAEQKDSAWADQISLMDVSIERSRQLCGITLIHKCGVMVDYDLHEVIDVTDTTDPAKDKQVSAIYRCGYLYKGTVVKKAQVSAYRTVSNLETSAKHND